MLRFALALALSLGVFSSSAARAEEDLSAAQKFFEAYLDAGYKYDKSILDMFAADAVSHITLLAADGTPTNNDFNAEQIRKALEAYVAEGEKQGVKMNFEKVSYAVTPKGVRVTATTQYTHLCYNDDLYAALLTRDDKGSYKIKEEFFRRPVESQCKKP